MSIEKIREIPRDLPPARLYLDDIKELTQIMVDACAPVLLRFHEEPNVVYIFGKGSRQDTKATSIEDLKSVGGSASEFTIKVGQSFGIELSVRGFLPPVVSLHLLSDGEARALYQKVESVFRHRTLALKYSLLQLPSWLKSLTWWLVVLVLPLTITIVLGTSLLAAGTKVALGLICFALMLGSFVGAALHSFQSSRVIFEDSYERSKQSVETQKGYARSVAFALLGAGLTLIVQIVLKKLFH